MLGLLGSIATELPFKSASLRMLGGMPSRWVQLSVPLYWARLMPLPTPYRMFGLVGCETMALNCTLARLPLRLDQVEVPRLYLQTPPSVPTRRLPPAAVMVWTSVCGPFPAASTEMFCQAPPVKRSTKDAVPVSVPPRKMP